MDTKKRIATLDHRWPGGGPASTQMLRDADISPTVLTTAVRAGEAYRLRRGVYIRAADWKDRQPWEQALLRLHAHYLATGGTAIYCSASAARWYGLTLWCVPDRVHITVPYSATASSFGSDTMAHRWVLEPADSVILAAPTGERVRTTSLERTVVDCARQLPFPAAVVLGDDALRRGASATAMADMVERLPGNRGVQRARKVLAALDRRSESAGETRTRLLLRSFALPEPDLQYVIATRAGNYRADFAWPQHKLILEFDGRTKYFAYAPTDDVLFQERRREKLLTELGWRILRIEWRDLDNPADLQMRVRAMLRPSLDAETVPGRRDRP